MEDSKKPALDKVKKLESLDIHEWVREKENRGYKFTARVNWLNVRVFIPAKMTLNDYHKITVSSQDDRFYVEYFKGDKNSAEEKSLGKFYEKLCKEYEEYYKKEFEEILSQVFSD